jgi:hypothetical protein
MTPTWQFWLNWWVQLAVAIGTIGAVVVALFSDWFRVVLWPPRLSIWLHDPLGEITKTVVPLPNGQQEETVSRWYHVRIENRRGWSLAREVRLLLLRYEEPDRLGQFQTKWSGAIPLKWQHQEIKLLAPTMGPPDNADLCSVVRAPPSGSRPRHWLQLHPLVRPLAMPPTMGDLQVRPYSSSVQPRSSIKPTAR